MSADNYIYVRKRDDGDYGVSHRCASVYYEDRFDDPRGPMECDYIQGDAEGWHLHGDSNIPETTKFPTVEDAENAATRRPDWLIMPPLDAMVSEDAANAIVLAHKWIRAIGIVEYGVIVSDEVLHDAEG